ncbi:hypothetical protein DIURU_003873 [Diutina rugosa]|uniref:Uncharacterized protein n=1 Tax=Diutina rugosa TaxID=5481 RepID=A0A642ULM0_DIURU|nr:uncharacterized protein DIURU_003873 [Diutina rugosa]KAA8900292.1 hypothetical protein DIURU_003873 [Diutina rugosa]
MKLGAIFSSPAYQQLLGKLPTREDRKRLWGFMSSYYEMVKHRDESLDDIYHNEFPLSDADFCKQHGGVGDDNDKFAQLVYDTNRDIRRSLKLMKLFHYMSNINYTNDSLPIVLFQWIPLALNIHRILNTFYWETEENPNFTEQKRHELCACFWEVENQIKQVKNTYCLGFHIYFCDLLKHPAFPLSIVREAVMIVDNATTLLDFTADPELASLWEEASMMVRVPVSDAF